MKYLLCIASLMLPSSALAQSAADIAAVQALPERYVESWQKHDGKLMASLVSDDIDFINVGAVWFSGKPDFELYHTRLLSGRFRDSSMKVLDSKVKFVRPDLAFVRWGWEIRDDKDFDGAPRPPRVGLMTFLAERQGGEWVIIAGQNTNGLPGPAPEEEGITFPITLPNPEVN